MDAMPEEWVSLLSWFRESFAIDWPISISQFLQMNSLIWRFLAAIYSWWQMLYSVTQARLEIFAHACL